MGNAFGPFGELWLPMVFKVLTVKIQVMSQAADRAARTILYSINSGHARILPALLDQCAAKSPILRRSGYELSAMVFARWKTEFFDK
jgi:hypothetical protein